MRLEKYQSRGEFYRVLDNNKSVIQVNYSLNITPDQKGVEKISLFYGPATIQHLSAKFYKGRPQTQEDKSTMKTIKSLDDRVQSALTELAEHIRKLLRIRTQND